MRSPMISKEEAVSAVAQYSTVIKTQVNLIREQMTELNGLMAMFERAPSDLTSSHVKVSKAALTSLNENRGKVVAGFSECKKTLAEMHKVIVRRARASITENE